MFKIKNIFNKLSFNQILGLSEKEVDKELEKYGIVDSNGSTIPEPINKEDLIHFQPIPESERLFHIFRVQFTNHVVIDTLKYVKTLTYDGVGEFFGSLNIKNVFWDHPFYVNNSTFNGWLKPLTNLIISTRKNPPIVGVSIKDIVTIYDNYYDLSTFVKDKFPPTNSFLVIASEYFPNIFKEIKRIEDENIQLRSNMITFKEFKEKLTYIDFNEVSELKPKYVTFKDKEYSLRECVNEIKDLGKQLETNEFYLIFLKKIETYFNL